MTSTTIATLTSQLNTLIACHDTIIRQAESYAEDLERFETPLKELKKIAADWNVVPDNKTKKASYIAALQTAHAEKNGLHEVNEQIEKVQFQIRCAKAQERANAEQHIMRVFRVDEAWWVGTDEEFLAYHTTQGGMEIHYTAHPEMPTVLTQEIEINNITYTVVGRDEEELAQETAKLEQEVNAQWQEVNQVQEPTLYERIRKGESINVKTAQGVHFTIQPTYWENIVLGYTVIQNGKIVPSYEGLMLDTDTAKDWLAGLGEDIPEQAVTPLQGVASFFESLAIFASHDILPFNVTDMDLYRELKAKWDAMNGDTLCECEWCDAEPLQEQEELQHTAALFAHVILQQSPLSYVDILPKGNITIATQEGTVTLSAQEAYNLLEALYQARDVLYQEAQKNESEPQNSSPILYTIITDHLDTFARMGYPIRYLLPDATTPELFHSSDDAEREFLAKYPDAEYIELDEMDQECKKRENEYWEKHPSQEEKEDEPENTTPILYAVGTHHSDFSVRYLMPNAITPEWFGYQKFSDPGEASQEFLTKYPDAEYVSAEELEEEAQKREKEYWEKQPLQGRERTQIVQHIKNRVNWTQSLATTLEQVQDGDIVVVPNYDMLELAESAWKRMNPDNRYVRIMTPIEFADLDLELPEK